MTDTYPRDPFAIECRKLYVDTGFSIDDIATTLRRPSSQIAFELSNLSDADKLAAANSQIRLCAARPIGK